MNDIKNTFLVVAALAFLLNANLIRGADSARVDELSATNKSVAIHPVVASFFEGKDVFVRDTVIPGIEANRKSDVSLQFVSSAGEPLAKYQVSVELKQHEFLFGHCELATERDPKTKKLLNEVFHYTCPGYATKWKAFSPEPGVSNFSKVDAILDFCEKQDIVFEWHFLSGYHPAWLESVASDEEKARLQLENARAVLKRYHGKVRFFQVFNEDWLTHIKRARVFENQTTFFSRIRSEFPDVELGVCDCWSFNSERQLPNVDVIEERYPGINFVSMHAHRPRQLWASPKEMYSTYDPYLNSDIKVHVTEFGIIKGEITGSYRSGEWDDRKLAEYFVQAAATAFSHDSVRVFNFWSNYEKFTGNPLFTEEGEPNVKYLALKSLIHDKLTTRVAGKTNQKGQCNFRGFHGKYDVTLKLASGEESTVQMEVGKGTADFKVIVDQKTGAVVVRNQ